MNDLDADLAEQAAAEIEGAATDDVPGGPVFTVLPAWEATGRASEYVASEDVRPQVVHSEKAVSGQGATVVKDGRAELALYH